MLSVRFSFDDTVDDVLVRRPDISTSFFFLFTLVKFSLVVLLTKISIKMHLREKENQWKKNKAEKCMDFDDKTVLREYTLA